MSVTPLSVAVTFHNVLLLNLWKDLMLATMFKINQQMISNMRKPVTMISAAAMMKGPREKSILSTSTATVKMKFIITTIIWVITCFNSYHSLIVAQTICCHLLPQATQSKANKTCCNLLPIATQKKRSRMGIV